MAHRPTPNPIDRERMIVHRRRHQRAEISGLAARLADAIRYDDGEALDRAQAALHQIDRDQLPPSDTTT